MKKMKKGCVGLTIFSKKCKTDKMFIKPNGITIVKSINTYI